MAAAARVLWTNKPNKKVKSYHDGFLLITAAGTAQLYDAAGKQLAVAEARLPRALAADPASAEDLAAFEGFLVQGDAPCSPNEVYAARDGGSSVAMLQGSTAAASTATATALNMAKAGSSAVCGTTVLRRSSSKQQPTAAAVAGDRHKPRLLQQQVLVPQIGRRRSGKAAGAADRAPVLPALHPQQHQQHQHQQHQQQPPPSQHQHQHQQHHWGPGASLVAPSHQQRPDAAGPAPRMGMVQQPPPPALPPPAWPDSFAHAGRTAADAPAASDQHSDAAVLQLLDSITPAGCDIWGFTSTPAAAAAAAAAPAPLQQQQQLPRPVVPQLMSREQQRASAAAAAAAAAPQQQAHHPHPPPPSWQQQQQQPPWLQAQQARRPAADPGAGALAGAPQPQVPAWQAADPPRQQQQQQQQQHQAWGAPAGARGAQGGLPGRSVLQPLQDNRQQQQWRQNHYHHHQQQQQQQQQQPEHRSWPGVKASAAPGSAAGGPPVPAIRQGQAGFSAPRLAAAQGPGLSNSGSSGAIGQQQQKQQALPGSVCFPGPGAGPPVRRVAIPDTFTTDASFISTQVAAVMEEVSLHLQDHARSFFNIVQQQQQQAGSHKQQPQQQRLQHGGGGGSSQQALTAGVQAACARAGLRLHVNSTLTVYENNGGNSSSNNRGGWGGRGTRGKQHGSKGRRQRKRRGGGAGEEADDDDDDGGSDGDDEQQQPTQAMYLTLSGKLDRRHYRKHDLWVLSSDELLGAAAAATGPPGGPVDRTRRPWTVLARALWHGPDRDGKMAVELLPGQEALLPAGHTWRRSQTLTALQGPDVASDVQAAEFIGSSSSSGGLASWPLLNTLLRAAPGGGAALAPAAAADPGGSDGAASREQAAIQDGQQQPASSDDAAMPRAADNVQAPTAAPGPAADSHHHQQQPDGMQEATEEEARPSNQLPAALLSSDADSDDDSIQPVLSRRGMLSGRKRAAADGGHAGAAAAGGGIDDGGSLSQSSDSEIEGMAANRSRRKRRQLAAKAAADAALEDSSSGWEVSAWEDEPDSPPARQRQRQQQPRGRRGSARRPTSSGQPSLLVSGQLGSAGAEADTSPAQEASVGALAEELLRDVVSRFNLNEGQAAVAAHVASWLPSLMHDVQARQQQQRAAGGRRAGAAVRPASASAAAAGADGSDGVRGGPAGDAGDPRLPVCLVHGPFGSGKSTLLCALVHLLTELPQLLADRLQQAAGSDGTRARARKPAASTQQQQQQPALPTPRVLVAAHTNVAVDRVLLGLRDAGFSDMLRVGSLPRIAKPLLGVSLHSADDTRDALAQLQSMLQHASGAEEAMIRAEIGALQTGAERRRRRALSTAAVVGVTCCSALQPTLEGQAFDVVLLDEASQMTEPTSLIPLLRARPRFLIAAGDPCQLPPVIASPTGVAPLPGGGPQRYGLLRPLFVRLAQLGCPVHLLTHQYRCHPALSLLSNKHFYNGRLVDGVSAAARAPLVVGLAPLTLCDVAGSCSQAAGGGGRSSINRAEAQLAAQLVVRLLLPGGTGNSNSHQGDGTSSRQQHVGAQQQQQQDDQQDEQQDGGGADPRLASLGGSDDDGDSPAAGLAPHQLGVICFFRGQAALIKQLLAAEAGACPAAVDVQVATVDAFQGAEKDVVLLATTTTNPRSEFCSDGARLNVALTRARHHLLVLGAASVLAQAPSPVLRELVHSCRGSAGGGQAPASFMSGSGVLQLLAAAGGQATTGRVDGGAAAGEQHQL